MPKPGKSAETHRKRHVADMSGEIPRPPWVDAYDASVPEWDVCDVIPFYVSAQWDGQVYQRVRRDPESNQVVDFAVAIQVQPAGSDEGWVDLARIDCAHGEVHIHSSRDAQRAGPGRRQRSI